MEPQVERVADYPRPPVMVASEQLIEVRALGALLVRTAGGIARIISGEVRWT